MDLQEPRRLMVCTGPPSKENADGMLAEMVAGYDGKVIICGGTTAKILGRKLKREVTVELKRDPSGLPPASRMEGVDMVTEGVLTLTKVRDLLETGGIAPASASAPAEGIAADIIRLILDSDRIEFIVGTCINFRHRDNALPVKLARREELVRSIAALLKDKYAKEVQIKYI